MAATLALHARAYPLPAKLPCCDSKPGSDKTEQLSPRWGLGLTLFLIQNGCPMLGRPLRRTLRQAPQHNGRLPFTAGSKYPNFRVDLAAGLAAQRMVY